ncbi:MAG: hypothetical protein EHM65_02150 [Acidobacteriales bacterium]|nr:MAG: hypothetical protein EHM65_02150 [Terriglobales bacterium]
MQDIESGQAAQEAEDQHVREQKRKNSLTLEEAHNLYPTLSDEDRYVKVYGTPEDLIGPGTGAACTGSARGEVAKEEPERAPAVQE